MLRTFSFCVAATRSKFSGHEIRRVCQKLQSVIDHHSVSRSVQTSVCKLADNNPVSPHKKKKGLKASVATKKKETVSAEMHQAVVNVAKSFPGVWTKTAEELLARLQLQQMPEAQRHIENLPENVANNSLLTTMDVGRTFESVKERRHIERASKRRRDNELLHSFSIVRPAITNSRIDRREGFTKLYGAKRLDIFDADKIKKEAAEGKEVSKEVDDLWKRMNDEHVRRVLGGIPRNGFEEMIQWTKEGRQWIFPIDNERDMEEERKYKFYHHIFLEQHLTEFPDKGPIRKFMELVVLGLSMNPWISVPEKIEHIQWFAQYFREKQDIIEATVGEEGNMKPPPQVDCEENKEVNEDKRVE